MDLPGYNANVCESTEKTDIKMLNIFRDKESTDIILTGQNCWSVMQEYKEVIRREFKNAGRRIRLVVNDPDDETCVKAWSTVSGGNVGIDFESDLNDAVESMKVLRDELSPDNFNFWFVPLMPLNACFVNPGGDDALLTITPVSPRSYMKDERPQFWILGDSEERKNVIEFYWKAVAECLKRKPGHTL